MTLELKNNPAISPDAVQDTNSPDWNEHEHVAEHGYDEVERPGALGEPLSAPERTWTILKIVDVGCP